MKLMLQCALLLAVLAVPCAAEVIDRTVATVNSRVILLSDWDDAVRFEAFMENRPLSALTPAGRQAVLKRLVDQELLREQMREGEFDINPHEIHKKLDELRAQFPGAASEAGWRALLESYGLTETEVAERVVQQVAIMRFIEHRLRPSVQIEPGSVEAYYRERLLPELRRKGGVEVPLPEVSGRIREVLAQQRMDELLSAWLESLRSQSQIRLMNAAERQAAEVR